MRLSRILNLGSARDNGRQGFNAQVGERRHGSIADKRGKESRIGVEPKKALQGALVSDKLYGGRSAKCAEAQQSGTDALHMDGLDVQSSSEGRPR